MKKLPFFLSFLLFLVIGFHTETFARRVVRIRPCAPRVIVVNPMCPGPGYVYVPGYWTNIRGRKVWVEGHWRR